MRLQTASPSNEFSFGSPATHRLNVGLPATMLLFLSLATAFLSGCAGGWGGTAPTLKSVPASQTTVAGQPVTFSVVAAGTGPFTYQWVRDANAIAGANSSSYTLQNPTAADSGVPFAAIVTNPAGSVTSPAATLIVDVPVSLVAAPASQTLMVGQSATFTVSASGTQPITYQWLRNGAVIAGATGATLTTPPMVATDNGETIAATVTNPWGAVTTPAAMVTVNSPPMLTVQPMAQTVNAGQSASFGVAVTGTQPMSYQWYRSGVTIFGATGSTYTTPALQVGDNGSAYAVKVTNVAGSASSTAAAVTVNSPPTLSVLPVSQTVTAPAPATFAVAASGTGPFTYQWTLNSAPIAGATAPSYTTGATAAADSGSAFAVTVTGPAGTVTTPPALLTVNVTPTLTAQPQSATVTAGQTATFSVAANGTGPFTYQWFRNGAPIAGGVASYTTPVLAAADSGAVYTVSVSNAAGSVTSAPATLTVTTAPTLTMQPLPVSVNAGQPASFSVAASGTGPFTYQWLRSGAPIAGATGPSYTFTTASTDNGASFAVTVANSVSSVTSAAALLTVNSAPAILLQPQSTSVAVGATATFFVSASGTGPLSYQWLRSGAAIPGATSSTYVTPIAAAGDSGATYAVTISNAVSSVTSATATLTVNDVPTLTAQPMAVTVGVGQPATFSVVAAGTGPFTYQWYRGGGLLAGATASSYTLASPVAADNGSVFTVTVSNALGSVNSAPATLTVNQPPSITQQPFSQTVNVGQGGIFTVVASGTGPYTYQWLRNGAAIAGATSASYTTPVTTSADNNATFTCAVTNMVTTVTSTPATLTVVSAPTLSAQPVSATVNVGQTATFSITAGGTGPFTYQWFRNGSYIPGATAATYTTAATTASDNGAVFYVIVADAAGSVTSANATLTVNLLPTITTQPQSVSVNSGSAGLFQVIVAQNNGPFTYQWFKNGTALPGASSNTYTTAPVSSSDNNAVFLVAVTNAVGTTNSVPATLTVLNGPTITAQPSSTTVNAGQPAIFEVTATGSGTLVYQWYKNGAYVAGATGRVYTTPATTAADNNASFSVTIADAAGSVNSLGVVLSVVSAPTLAAAPQSESVNAGQPATFAVTANGTAPFVYQWFRNGSLLPGASASAYTVANTSSSDNNAAFTVTVANAAGSVTSPAAVLTVNTTPLAQMSCSTMSPGYNGSITLNPVFSGGTATLGTSGLGSSNVSTSLTTGVLVQTAALTTPTTFTLTVTGQGGAQASTSCTATPTQVTMGAITPANSTVAPGTVNFADPVSGGATNNLTWTTNGGSFNGSAWTAPNTAGTYSITATSVDNPSVHMTTSVTVSAPVITQQPVSQGVCSAANVTLTAAANYASAYQWNLNGTPLSGDTSSSLFLAGVTSNSAGTYTLTASNLLGGVTTSPAVLTVGSTITTQPVSFTVSSTQTATFSVAATGNGPFTYQWYLTAAGGSATAISGATSSSYTTPAATTQMSGNQYYAVVSDGCGSTLTSNTATLTVNNNAVPPTIQTQPQSQSVAVGSTPTLTVAASGTRNLTYQWYTIAAGSPSGSAGYAISGATANSYTLPASATNQSNDQDQYYAIVSNGQGHAVSQAATIAVGAGILLTINNQPTDQYVNNGAPATFSVNASSTATLTYQWYSAPAGSSQFTAISGATANTYTIPVTDSSMNSSAYYVVVSNGGATAAVQSNTVALFVGALNTVGDLCQSPWIAVGNATAEANCTFQLTAAVYNQHGEIVWPNLIATGNLQLAFTITMSNPTDVPADGFAVVLGDPTQGATTSSIGSTGQGIGAEGIPGWGLVFDTYQNGAPDAPIVPYVGITNTNTSQFENPYFNTNDSLPAIVAAGQTISHDYVISIVSGEINVTMDGVQIFSGAVTVPPVAYLYVTASTGGKWEDVEISNLTSTVSAPSH